MSMPGIIAPLSLGSAVFYRDYMAMAAITLILISLIGWALWRKTKTAIPARLSRFAGVALLLLYVLYYLLLIPTQ